jgi:hypothetical protein
VSPALLVLTALLIGLIGGAALMALVHDSTGCDDCDDHDRWDLW